MKHILIILISLLLLSSPLFGQSEEKPCYVSVNSSEEFNQTLLSNISMSIISQYFKEVKPFPPSGLGGSDNCIYEVSVTKDGEKTFVTLQGKDLNSYGDSKLDGTDGFQQSLLKSLYRSLKNKRRRICEDYGELLEKCKNVVVEEIPQKVEPKVVESKVPTPKVEPKVTVNEKNKICNEKYYVLLSNIDDNAVVYVNNKPILKRSYNDGTNEIEKEITNYLKFGENTVKFVLINKQYGYTYKYELRKEKEYLLKEECGVFNKFGCNNDSHKKGVVVTLENQINCSP